MDWYFDRLQRVGCLCLSVRSQRKQYCRYADSVLPLHAHTALCVFCSSRSSMWLARSFGNRYSIRTKSRGGNRLTHTDTINQQVTNCCARTKNSSKFFVLVSLCLSQLEKTTQFAVRCFVSLILISRRARLLSAAHYFSHFCSLEKAGEKEWGRDGETESRQHLDLRKPRNGNSQ